MAINAWTTSDDQLRWTLDQATFDVDQGVNFFAWPASVYPWPATTPSYNRMKPCTASALGHCLTANHFAQTAYKSLWGPKTWSGAGSYYNIWSVPTWKSFVVQNANYELGFNTNGDFGTALVFNFYMPNDTQRCDNGMAGDGNYGLQGCVIQQDVPTYFVHTAKNYSYAWHVYPAQLSGLPGQAGANKPLHRIQKTTGGRVQANRDVACPSSGYPQRPALTPVVSCDEYPMATTFEGAGQYKRYPKLPARTIRGVSGEDCHMPLDYGYVYLKSPILGAGYSRCFIPDSENTSEGGYLGNFYSKYRIIWEATTGVGMGDAFEVGYDNTGV